MCRKIASLVLLLYTVDSIWSKSVSCWILHDCIATVLNMEEYEKKYSHTNIKIKNNKEKNCDIDNKYIVI